MPRLKAETYLIQGKAGNDLCLKLDINISADGIFYATVPDNFRDAFAQHLVTASRLSRAANTIRIEAPTLEELNRIIRDGLKRHMEPEITETVVIRYNIESHVSFAVDDNGTIFPNAAFPGARWPFADDRFGSHSATRTSSGGYSLTIGAKAQIKCIFRHGENERVEYEPYYAGGSHHDREHPAQLLNSWCSFSLGGKPREIPYSDKSALFFHGLMLSMAALSRQVQEATFAEEDLLALIEKQGELQLLPAPQTHGR